MPWNNGCTPVIGYAHSYQEPAKGRTGFVGTPPTATLTDTGHIGAAYGLS
jgi:hypothetical protein